MAVQETRTTKETAVFAVDTVVIVAGGLAFAFALLGWFAGHRISLALPAEVTTRAVVPLLVGVSGLFLGAGIGLLLGELKRVEETVTTTTTPETTDLAGDVVTHVVEALKSLTPARAVLAVGVILLLSTVWLVKPPDNAAAPAPAGPTVTAPVVTGTVLPTALPTVLPTPTR